MEPKLELLSPWEPPHSPAVLWLSCAKNFAPISPSPAMGWAQSASGFMELKPDIPPAVRQCAF